MIYVECDEIVAGLWQGSYPEPGREVSASGFDVLVLCAIELQTPEEEYPGVTVIHAPNEDDSSKPLSRSKLNVALKAAKQVVSAVQEGKKVLVTCAAGLNRSGLVTGIALHLLHGWDGTKCVKTVQEKRTPLTTRSGEVLTALCNPEFVKSLVKLAKKKDPLPDGWTESSGGVLIPPDSGS